MVIALATGITMGVWAGWWLWGWFWASLILFLAVSFVMTPLVATPYNRIRRALGLKAPQGFMAGKMPIPERPPTPQELEELLSGPYPLVSTIVGIVAIVLLVWLMMFKPF